MLAYVVMGPLPHATDIVNGIVVTLFLLSSMFRTPSFRLFLRLLVLFASRLLLSLRLFLLLRSSLLSLRLSLWLWLLLFLGLSLLLRLSLLVLLSRRLFLSLRLPGLRGRLPLLRLPLLLSLRLSLRLSLLLWLRLSLLLLNFGPLLILLLPLLP